MFKKLFHASPAEGGGGGGGSPAAAPAPAPAPAAAAAATPPGQGSSLGVALNLDSVPEKYRVMGADGKTFDELASLRKLATDGYTPLAKRLGSGELPPAKVEDYQFTAPQGIDAKQYEAFIKDPGTQEFVKSAHAKGINNEQMNFLMEEYIKVVPDLMAGDAQARDAATTAYFDKAGVKGQAFGQVVANAKQVANAFASKTGMGFDVFQLPLDMGNGIVLPPLLNDPRFLMLAKAIAPELAEDLSAGDVGGGGGMTFEEQVAAIDKQLNEMQVGDKRRSGLIEQKLALFERKHPKGGRTFVQVTPQGGQKK